MEKSIYLPSDQDLQAVKDFGWHDGLWLIPNPASGFGNPSELVSALVILPTGHFERSEEPDSPSAPTHILFASILPKSSGENNEVDGKYRRITNQVSSRVGSKHRIVGRRLSIVPHEPPPDYWICGNMHPLHCEGFPNPEYSPHQAIRY